MTGNVVHGIPITRGKNSLNSLSPELQASRVQPVANSFQFSQGNGFRLTLSYTSIRLPNWASNSPTHRTRQCQAITDIYKSPSSLLHSAPAFVRPFCYISWRTHSRTNLISSLFWSPFFCLFQLVKFYCYVAFDCLFINLLHFLDIYYYIIDFAFVHECFSLTSLLYKER